ncbi:hypothetical protein CQA49_04945 [Helicobacter sp. MIT 00-7814]|uniref:hypothetical protein n=1 Tax=Helicobacter TaxID=209 RepID=UPI000E1EC3FF|nr:MULTISPECIES: hypothetical protein [unclassified Helicobacter]RDU54348.1 hypothetical protein CQA37_05435 [Helicobacter sp. MIT 99-10781]RDU54425.1 hypothetical protein CQA49_04945 [Helicobacter sp. MIT 00-7814]
MKEKFKHYKHAKKITESTPELLEFFEKECVRLNDLVTYANLGHLKQYANNRDLGFYVVVKGTEGLRIGSYFEKETLRKMRAYYVQRGFKSKNLEVVWKALEGMYEK